MLSWRKLLALGLVTALTTGCAAVGLGLAIATPAGPTTTRLVAMTFLNADTGWLVGSDCPIDANTAASTACRSVVYQTVDGGRSWSQLARFLLSPRSIQFVDATTGWMVGSIGEKCGADLCPNVVMLSQDAGKTWNRVSMVSAALTGAAASSADDAWAVGQSCRPGGACGAVLVRTTTAGQIWDNADLSLIGSGVYVDRLDRLHGWIGNIAERPGALSSILVTSDGGSSWRVDTSPCLGGTSGLNFTSPLVGWLYCDASAQGGGPGGTLYHSVDGGNSWLKVSQVSTGTSGNGGVTLPSLVSADPKTNGGLLDGPTGLAFTTASSGWVARRDGQLFATADAGQSWHVAVNAGEPLRGLQFTDQNHGWLLGTSSMWLTIDGGQTWSKVSPLS